MLRYLNRFITWLQSLRYALEPAVTEGWLAEHRYDRGGDRP